MDYLSKILMTMKTNMWVIVSVIFLVWAVGASTIAASYFQTAQNQQKTITSLQALIDEVSIKASIAINYGNGTVVWYNNTVFPIDVSLFNATTKIANVTYYTSFDIYVTGINGVMQDPSSNKYWIFKIWTNDTWVIDWTPATAYILSHNEPIMWTLETWT